MKPISRNLTIYAGESFSNTIYTNIMDSSNNLIDFTSHIIYAKFRENFQSNTTYLMIGNGEPNSVITLSMNASSTANLVPMRYFYDVFVSQSNIFSKAIQGILTVYPSVDSTP